MTRARWIVQWREERIKQRKSYRPLSQSTINSVLIELYCYHYLPKQQVVIDLVAKYYQKLSPEYLRNHENLMKKWKPEAKERVSKLLQELIYCKNPLLSMISKDSNFSGKYIPVPIKP